MLTRTYAISPVKRNNFYRKSELQMFLLISGDHIGVPFFFKKMTKWRMLGSIFNSVNFSRNFITSGFSFLLFLSILLYTDQFFNHVCYDVCGF